VPTSGKWAKPSNAEKGKRIIEVKGTMIAHHWDKNSSQWIADATLPAQVPTQVQLSGSSTINSSLAGSQQLPASSNTNPQSGNLAANSIDAAAQAARAAAAARARDYLDQMNN
jgi:hypothetical protein